AERVKPLVRTHRQQPVPVADLDDAVVVLRLGEFAPQQPLPQDAQLVAIEVADEIVYDLGPGPFGGLNSVPPQLLEHLWAVPVRLSHRACSRPLRASPGASERSRAAPAHR